MEPEGWDDDTLRANPAKVLLHFAFVCLRDLTMEAARRMWGGTKCFYSCSVGCELV